MKKILIVEYKDEQEFSEMLAIACGFDVDIKTATPPTDEEKNLKITELTLKHSLDACGMHGAMDDYDEWLIKQLGL